MKKAKGFKCKLLIKLMKKRLDWIEVILLFWAYFFGIFITSMLFSNRILPNYNQLTQSILSVIVGFIFAYFVIKTTNKFR